MNSEQETLIERHLDLVKWRVYQLGYHTLSCADELYCEGRLALVKAALSFDPSRGTTFKYWAQCSIDRALKEFLRGEDTMTKSERRLYKQTGIFLPRRIAGHPPPPPITIAYSLDVDAFKRSLKMA